MDKLSLNWLQISLISKTKFVNNILLFVIFVPIVSKIFEKFGDEFYFNIDNYIYIIKLELPFSLGLFYFSSVFFLLGNILYKISVPSIIDENKSFSAFESDGKNKIHLINYYENDKIDNEDLDCTILYSDKILDRDELSDFFWNFWNSSLNKKIWFRFTITLLYSFGIIMIIILFLQNIYYVMKTMNLVNKFNSYITCILN